MGLTTRRLQDIGLRGIGPQIVQRDLLIHYQLADVQEIERYEAAMLMEQVLASDRPLAVLRGMADVDGLKLSPILQQVAAPSAVATVPIAAPAVEPSTAKLAAPASPAAEVSEPHASERAVSIELMIANNTITVAHAEALLKATPPEQRADVKPAEREKKTAPIEQIEKLQKEMDQVQESYTQAEENYCSDLLNLVVAKGYLTKLLANGGVKSYIGRHEPVILTHLDLVVNPVSMEEAVQQQGQEQP
jgi:hypothetical protein